MEKQIKELEADLFKSDWWVGMHPDSKLFTKIAKAVIEMGYRKKMWFEFWK